MDKELIMYLIFQPNIETSDKFVITRFWNKTNALNFINAFKKVGLVNKESIFRVYVYNKDAKDNDIINNGFQIAYISLDNTDFISSVEYKLKNY